MRDIIIVFLCVFSLNTFSQEQQNLEASFVKELNAIAALTWKTPKSDFNEHDSIVLIKPYEIKNKILSVTQQQKINDTLYTIKMEVLFSRITNVYIDIYTVLSFLDNDATVYKTNVTNGTKVVYKTQDWNVGIPFYDGQERTTALQKLLETMYYKAIQKPKATYTKPKNKR